MGIKLPDLAPSIEDYNIKNVHDASNNNNNNNTNKNQMIDEQESSSLYEPKKKKYAKEAWPGRKPTLPGSNTSGGASSGSTSPSFSFNLF